MLDFNFICKDCGIKPHEDYDGMICHYCGGDIRGEAPGISTDDTFGFKNQFKDEKSGNTIKNWKQWEKAGYRDPLSTTQNSNVKAGIKQKVDKIKSKNRTTVTVPGGG